METTTDLRIAEIRRQAERRQKALAMRNNGKKLHEIALVLEVSVQRAAQMVAAARAEEQERSTGNNQAK